VSDRGGIGSRVLAARKRLGWTREALAFHAGISWSAVAQVESGRRTNLRPRTLAALSRSLGVSIDYLVDGSRLPPTMLNHSEFPYRTDDQFQTTVGSFLAEGVERSEAVLAVTTLSNIELLREHLGQSAGNVEFINSSELLTTPVAALEAFRAFTKAHLGRGAAWVRVLGEPRWAERSEADVRLWTRFESMINLLFAASPMTVPCPYDERSVAPEILSEAHLTHPHTLGDGGITPSTDFTDPGRFTLGPEQPRSRRSDQSSR
jgi:transcriptional regulator with XRE-family HTH domain